MQATDQTLVAAMHTKHAAHPNYIKPKYIFSSRLYYVSILIICKQNTQCTPTKTNQK